ncbi:hypothetical protein GJ744_008789 [Endocarpon pusillum]|uniref:Uncharacterized protein n=1 Tax=Endocarpon pusillum TaxID=364733 RepID=A0A8H7AQA4_9EURO|nr:hypothetical protein GJ744_008789 [Endocarpon pusillum]
MDCYLAYLTRKAAIQLGPKLPTRSQGLVWKIMVRSSLRSGLLHLMQIRMEEKGNKSCSFTPIDVFGQIGFLEIVF